MNVVKFSSKHQIVIPPEIREPRGWKPGDALIAACADIAEADLATFDRHFVSVPGVQVLTH